MTDLPDTVVGSMTGDELWDSIEAQVKEWRVACCDEEGKDLLAFLQGKQVRRFLSVMYGQQWAFVQQKPIMDCLDDADTMEALVANLSNALAQKTEQLEKIHNLSRPHYKEE
jgi:hypothetical protein